MDGADHEDEAVGGLKGSLAPKGGPWRPASDATEPVDPTTVMPLVVPPPPPPGPPPDVPPVPVGPPPGGPNSSQQRLVIAAIVLVVALLGVGLAFALRGGDDDEPVASPTTEQEETTTTEEATTTTEETTTTTEEVTTTTTEETTTTTERVTTTTEPEPEPEPPSTTGAGLPAPAGSAGPTAWWHPAATEYDSASVWVFDPNSEALPYGWRQDYIPTGSSSMPGAQFSFTYSGDPSAWYLSFPTGTVQDLSVISYDEASDTIEVEWEGYYQTWYGCDSGQMPTVALAACR